MPTIRSPVLITSAGTLLQVNTELNDTAKTLTSQSCFHHQLQNKQNTLWPKPLSVSHKEQSYHNPVLIFITTTHLQLEHTAE